MIFISYAFFAVVVGWIVTVGRDTSLLRAPAPVRQGVRLAGVLLAVGFTFGGVLLLANTLEERAEHTLLGLVAPLAVSAGYLLGGLLLTLGILGGDERGWRVSRLAGWLLIAVPTLLPSQLTLLLPLVALLGVPVLPLPALGERQQGRA